jgi:hypothetical protein
MQPMHAARRVKFLRAKKERLHKFNAALVSLGVQRRLRRDGDARKIVEVPRIGLDNLKHDHVLTRHGGRVRLNCAASCRSQKA